jgi:hypothetical protein
MITERKDVMRWLEELPILAELKDSKQAEAVRSLAGHEGFGLLIGLLMATRQAFYVQLANLPIGNSTDAARFSVLQGQTKGIDLVRETLLELFPDVTPAEDRSQ